MLVRIAVPAYARHIDVGMLASICSLLTDSSKQFELDTIDCSIPTEACNILVRRFLQSEAEWLLFWDNDIAVEKFLDKMLETSRTLNAGIVSVPCIVKQTGMLNCGNVIHGRVQYLAEADEPRLVDVAGRGLMLIARSVFDFVSAPWFEFIHSPDGVLSEDFNFCLKAREQGIKTAIEPRVMTTHYGVAGWVYNPKKSNDKQTANS